MDDCASARLNIETHPSLNQRLTLLGGSSSESWAVGHTRVYGVTDDLVAQSVEHCHWREVENEKGKFFSLMSPGLLWALL